MSKCTFSFIIYTEVVSKYQIRFKGKASRALEAERTHKYVSITMRRTTQPLGLRWDFATPSIHLLPVGI
jgi:hypothetical protein